LAVTQTYSDCGVLFTPGVIQ